MASNKGITKLATSVADFIRVVDMQIHALREFERHTRAVTEDAIERLKKVKIAAAVTMKRRAPNRPKKIRIVRKRKPS